MNWPAELWAGNGLLDRQLLDRDGLPCGKVDDLELDPDGEGGPVVTALLSGPGRLWTRLGARRLGRFLERATAHADSDGRLAAVPLAHVRSLGASIQLDLPGDRLLGAGTERWFRDHVIDAIPGSGRAAE